MKSQSAGILEKKYAKSDLVNLPTTELSVIVQNCSNWNKTHG